MEIKLKRKAFEAWHESEYGEHIIWSNDSPVGHIHNDRWQGWLAATANARTVPEGFVLVSSKSLCELAIAINNVDLATHTENKTNEVREMWQDIAIKLSSLGEAQEPSHD